MLAQVPHKNVTFKPLNTNLISKFVMQEETVGVFLSVSLPVGNQTNNRKLVLCDSMGERKNVLPESKEVQIWDSFEWLMNQVFRTFSWRNRHHLVCCWNKFSSTPDLAKNRIDLKWRFCRFRQIFQQDWLNMKSLTTCVRFNKFVH